MNKCKASRILPLLSSEVDELMSSLGLTQLISEPTNIEPSQERGKYLAGNYRPISLLPICGKIFEKIVFNQLYYYFMNNNLISKHQSGFRPGD